MLPYIWYYATAVMPLAAVIVLLARWATDDSVDDGDPVTEPAKPVDEKIGSQGG